MSKTDVSAWLRSETPAHLELLSRMRKTLTESLSLRQDENGRAIPPDVNEYGTPTRDWCRAYGAYQKGYLGLLSEERERAKLLVLSQRAGQTPLTDEEYEQEMRQLGLDAVKELDDASLAQALSARGLSASSVVVVDDTDD